MNWLDELIDEYYSFLREKTYTSLDNETGWFVISTPFTGIFNDTLDIYAKKEDNIIHLSDDGATIKNLELSGSSINRSAKRREILDNILMNYGIQLIESELIVNATNQNFAQKKHNLISAMIELNDLEIMTKHAVFSVFKEEVKGYLESQDIIYTPQFISKGSTGLEFMFDFQIAYKSKEIVVKAFNNVNKINLPNFLFTWRDIKEVRENITQKKVVGIALINNEDKEIKKEYLDAFNSQGAGYILWSDRFKKENLVKLVA
jgi:Domain of unknown function DUF1828./Domain of unknown function DUF1829.